MKAAISDTAADKAGSQAPDRFDQRFEYDVVELREKWLDAAGSAPTDKLRRLLNERATAGWQLKNLVSAEVAGMIGKRDGWMVIFERDLQAASRSD